MKARDRSRSLTSPCKGEVGGEASGRGSASRFSRTKKITRRAQRLRRTMTDAETKLWNALRRDQLDGMNFRRQHPVGPFVLDFYCPVLKFGIEIDGGQHNTTDSRLADAQRTAWLKEKGIAVARYWNNDVLGNLNGVLQDILRIIDERRPTLTPSPTLPLSGGGSRRSARQ